MAPAPCSAAQRSAQHLRTRLPIHHHAARCGSSLRPHRTRPSYRTRATGSCIAVIPDPQLSAAPNMCQTRHLPLSEPRDAERRRAFTCRRHARPENEHVGCRVRVILPLPNNFSCPPMDPMPSGDYSSCVTAESPSLALHSRFAQSITQTRHVNNMTCVLCLATEASTVEA